ncbi:hypothetical protein PSCICN_36300 [Pseudomonas cichorii]|nr:hypothetical protein PSCICN_36300 [Pseudomonas cichorii]
MSFKDEPNFKKEFEMFDEIEKSKIEIANCDLGDCDHQEHVDNKRKSLGLMEVDEKNPGALVAGDTVVSIVSGMSKENKQIIKDSVLLASLAANKKYRDSNENAVQWYETFTKVLGYCGWFSQSRELSDYRSSNTRFTMEQEALKILESAIVAMAVPGPTSVLLLKVAKDTVKALQASDKPLRLFENSSKTHKSAKFTIASAAESSDGEVVMAMGAVNFVTSQGITNVLFWEWNNASVRIKRAENNLVLNPQHYARVKGEVEAKLTANARSALAEFEI